LFIGVATQPATLLSPLLELASNEDLILLVLPLVEDVRRLKNTLIRFGIKKDSVIDFPCHSLERRDCLQQALQAFPWRDNCDEVWLITDRQQEIAALVYSHAFSEKPFYLVRSAKPRVALSVWSQSQELTQRDLPFTRRSADLRTLVHLTGHQLFENGEPKALRIWPIGPGSAPVLNDGAYGEDPVYTARCHDGLVTEKSQIDRTIEGITNNKPSNLQIWIKNWEQYLRSKNKNKQVLLCLYHATKKLLAPEYALNLNFCTPEQAVARLQSAAGRLQELEGSDISDVVMVLVEILTIAGTPLGKLFENAVSRRLVAWLSSDQAERYASIIHSVWKGVRICHERDPERVIAEFDILVVFKNGTLLHLECKSGQADLKDLLARSTVLRQINADAEIILATPLYTQFADRSWFQDQVRVFQELRNIGKFPVLAFTLRGQPRQCPIQIGPDIVEHVEVPHFEEAIAHLFQNWLPGSQLTGFRSCRNVDKLKQPLMVSTTLGGHWSGFRRRGLQRCSICRRNSNRLCWKLGGLTCRKSSLTRRQQKCKSCWNRNRGSRL
jgi:hypothetical protein